jgi:hypothetical protein
MFVTFAIQHAMHMHRIILPSVACPAVQYFSTLPHKWNDFSKTTLLNIKYVLIFSTVFVRNISYSKKNWATYEKIYVGLHVKYPLFLPEINLEFIRRI